MSYKKIPDSIFLCSLYTLSSRSELDGGVSADDDVVSLQPVHRENKIALHSFPLASTHEGENGTT
jgi:hypothetical protein